QVKLGVIQSENLQRFEPWVRHWNLTVSRAYLEAYFHKLDKSEIVPRNDEKLRVMLRAYLLHQVMGELAAELRRPTANLRATLRAIIFLTEEPLPLNGTPQADTNTNLPTTS